jgi:hypothetical protein
MAQCGVSSWSPESGAERALFFFFLSPARNKKKKLVPCKGSSAKFCLNYERISAVTILPFVFFFFFFFSFCPFVTQKSHRGRRK